MNIIFGDSVDILPDNYIILELDTFRISSTGKITTAYCVVEKLALDEFATIEYYKKIHADLIHAYRNQHWNYCEQVIEALMGRWAGELDTFYANMLNRIRQNKQNGVPSDWTAVILKN